MNRLSAPLFAAALLTPVSIQAQTAPAQTAPAGSGAPATSGAATAAPTVGATIYDPSGGVVGTVDSVTGDVAVVSTGTNKVGIPVASFGTGPNGPVVSITKAELDAQAAQQRAAATSQLDAQLVAGTVVHGRGGAAVVGTIKSADPQFITLTTATNGDVKLPRNGFSSGPNGVIIGLTADEFKAAISGSAAAPRR